MAVKLTLVLQSLFSYTVNHHYRTMQQQANITDGHSTRYDETYVLVTTIPLLIFGTIGNILTIFVLQRRGYVYPTLRVFLSALAVADVLSIWSDQITVDMFYFTRNTPIAEWECRTHVFFFGTASICSSWTLVLVTIERVFIVYKPLKTKVICTYRRAVGVTFVTWLIFGLAVAIFTITATYKDVCQNTGTQLGTFVVFYAFAPAGVIIICNIFIIVRVQKAKKKRKLMTMRSPTKNNDRFTWMLVTNSFAFVLLTIPGFLILIIHNSIPLPLAVLEIAEFVKRLNHAINFLLYCLSGATFRRELKNMITGVFSGRPSVSLGEPSGEILKKMSIDGISMDHQ